MYLVRIYLRNKDVGILVPIHSDKEALVKVAEIGKVGIGGKAVADLI